MSSRARYGIGSLLVASLVLVLAATARPAGPLPRLTGPALAGPTHLHLVVSGAPPYMYDVDSGSVRALSTPPNSPLGSWVRPSGNSAFVATDPACCALKAIAYRVALSGAVQRIAVGGSLAPAGSHTTWVLRRASPGQCRLSRIPGTRSSVPVPCRGLAGAGDAGVLMSTNSDELLIDTHTGQVRAQAARIVPLHGDLVLEETGQESLDEAHLSLVHVADGSRRPLGWPSILGGTDEIVAQPHGHLVAVGFGDPAYPGPAQAADVWILDTRTGNYTHLPGFPAQVDLKFSSMAWTQDGRLALLLQGGGRTVLAVWHPGSRTLPLRPLDLPPHTGGSDTFVPLVGA